MSKKLYASVALAASLAFGACYHGAPKKDNIKTVLVSHDGENQTYRKKYNVQVNGKEAEYTVVCPNSDPSSFVECRRWLERGHLLAFDLLKADCELDFLGSRIRIYDRSCDGSADRLALYDNSGSSIEDKSFYDFSPSLSEKLDTLAKSGRKAALVEIRELWEMEKNRQREKDRKLEKKIDDLLK